MDADKPSKGRLLSFTHTKEKPDGQVLLVSAFVDGNFNPESTLAPCSGITQGPLLSARELVRSDTWHYVSHVGF